MDNNMYTNSQIQYIDQEQLKILSEAIRKYVSDLNQIKKKSDEIWEQCSGYLEEGTLQSIDLVKSNNFIKYSSSIEELNNYANKIDTIANIWDETEREIRSSSKKLESFFTDINKTMMNAFERSKKQ